MILAGSTTYHYLEDWSWIEVNLLLCGCAGFGDFAPQTDAGKIFTTFYIIVGTGIILSFINTLYEHYNGQYEKIKP
ncbi:MAG: hypothetical protein ACJA19_000893 [Bacteroidia bacterium]|jgi:hypothetical protein